MVPNTPDFIPGSGYTAVTRGIPKNGDIRHYGDNIPYGQTGIVPGNPTPGNQPAAAEIPTPFYDNCFLPGGTGTFQAGIASITEVGGVATATFASNLPSNPNPGSVTIAGNSVSGYNGAHTPLSFSTTGFTFSTASTGTGSGGTAAFTGLSPAHPLDSQHSSSWATAGRKNGYSLQGGGTCGGGDSGDEGYDGYGKL